MTGMIYCAACGARYFPNKRPNGRVVYSCHSRAKKNKKMVRDPHCKSPHIPIEELDAMVEAEVLRLAANPAEVDELIKKRAAEGGDSKAVDRSEDIARLDMEISRLMDLLQRDKLASVEDIAQRIEKLHAERMSIVPAVAERSKGNIFYGLTKSIMLDLHNSWHSSSLRGRRAFLVQVIDRIQIDAVGVGIEWSFA